MRVEELTAVTDDVVTSFARLVPQLSIGALTPACFHTPTGTRAWIEDVDEAVRGVGIGAPLVEDAVRPAREAVARTIELTSRPDRGAARPRYRRVLT